MSCDNMTKENNLMKSAYVAFGQNKTLTEKSSSGGIFASLANNILSNGGVVYGAAMMYEDDKLQCKHIRIDKVDDLHLIQGSKYVHSRTSGVFQSVKKDLDSGLTVLFSGSSCQVFALKHFVGENEKLYTVDLVCHGVPKDNVFYDYIDYLERKAHRRIVGMSFRSKRKYNLYILERNSVGKTSERVITSRKSAYYQMFLQRAGYREACYNCRWASLAKPGNITLGDFIPRKDEVEKYGFDKSETYSSIIVHDSKGNTLIKTTPNLKLVQVTIDEMLSHHGNLKQPSSVTPKGKKLFFFYKKFGYGSVQRWIDLSNALRNILRCITFRKRIK